MAKERPAGMGASFTGNHRAAFPCLGEEKGKIVGRKVSTDKGYHAPGRQHSKNNPERKKGRSGGNETFNSIRQGSRVEQKHRDVWSEAWHARILGVRWAGSRKQNKLLLLEEIPDGKSRGPAKEEGILPW